MKAVLLQGLAAQPLPANRPLHYQQEGHQQATFNHQTGQGLARQAPREERPVPSLDVSVPHSLMGHPPSLQQMLLLPPPPPPVPDVPRSTLWWRKSQAEQAGGS